MKKILLIVSCLFFVYAYEEVGLSDSERKKLGIELVTIGQEVSTKGLPFNAFVDFDSKTSITQSSTFDVVVVALHKREGEKVRKGEVICEISSSDLNNLFFELENAQNRYDIANEIAKKDKLLFESGVISQREYQVSYLNAGELRLKLDQVKSTFDVFGIDIKKPKGKFGFRIVAKEDGILAVAPKQTGEKIIAFSPYIRIVDGLDLMARIRVPINMVYYVKPGAKVFDNQGKQIGVITTVSVVIDRSTNTVLATASLRDTKFKVGETIEAYIDSRLPQDSIVVPVEAIIKNNGDYLVFKKTQKGFLPIKIQILEEKNRAFIINAFDKIKVGDEVAIGSIIALKGIINNIGD
ncbi:MULTISPECIES: efflux RND transporter periplasmic adaptor subunit [unclassified Helicobacter]|uniref:efflux RND transporter periplasmic adaptor subunit n=1 Tax=unclassified Helicobacter TaxID=2593540 RepID=UPI000CF07EF8|nr:MULTISPECIES: sodium:proton antiporter [unclassified Helicobacter]